MIKRGQIRLTEPGFDSVIEVTSGAALLWRLRHDQHVARRAALEQTTLRIVGLCFLALAGYVAYDSGRSLLRHERPGESWLGIAIAAASLIVMPLLARAKRRVAIQIHSQALRADAKQTEFCTYLSAILLGGLLLHAILGWWWADPVAALIMVPIIGREGVAALQGHACEEACGQC